MVDETIRKYRNVQKSRNQYGGDSELSEATEDADIRPNPNYACDRCGAIFETPQLLRDHQEDHVGEGDEEVQEEWEHTPGNPNEEVPSLGGDTNEDTA